MGSLHSFETCFPGSVIEHDLWHAGADPFVLLTGTNVVGGYDDIDHRFDFPPLSVVVLMDDWVGNLPANTIMSGGMQAARRLTSLRR